MSAERYNPHGLSSIELCIDLEMASSLVVEWTHFTADDFSRLLASPFELLCNPRIGLEKHRLDLISIDWIPVSTAH